MNNLHDTILERYFWSYVDRGEAPAGTPLFTGSHHGKPLSDIIRDEFHLSSDESEAAIEAARREVEL